MMGREMPGSAAEVILDIIPKVKVVLDQYPGAVLPIYPVEIAVILHMVAGILLILPTMLGLLLVTDFLGVLVVHAIVNILLGIGGLADLVIDLLELVVLLIDLVVLPHLHGDLLLLVSPIGLIDLDLQHQGHLGFHVYGAGMITLLGAVPSMFTGVVPHAPSVIDCMLQRLTGIVVFRLIVSNQVVIRTIVVDIISLITDIVIRRFIKLNLKQ